MAQLQDITAFLDKVLRISDIPDDSNNGLQVYGKEQIARIGFAVDACYPVFEKASELGCDMLVVHHGISWKDSLKQITGTNYKRLAFLLNHGISLYGVHLPLDLHEKFGNNIQLCRLLGFKKIRRFGLHQGKAIGFSGIAGCSITELVSRTELKLKTKCTLYKFGDDISGRVAVVSGGGAAFIEDAAREGIKTLLTGEMKYSAYYLAKENCFNLIIAGHYATEVFGVRSLAVVVKKRFKVHTHFIEEDVHI